MHTNICTQIEFFNLEMELVIDLGNIFCELCTFCITEPILEGLFQVIILTILWISAPRIIAGQNEFSLAINVLCITIQFHV